MVVYVDNEGRKFRSNIRFYMLADTPAELHAMAKLVGASYRHDFRFHPPCYEINAGRRKLALKNGAIEIAIGRRNIMMSELHVADLSQWSAKENV